MRHQTAAGLGPTCLRTSSFGLGFGFLHLNASSVTPRAATSTHDAGTTPTPSPLHPQLQKRLCSSCKKTGRTPGRGRRKQQRWGHPRQAPGSKNDGRITPATPAPSPLQLPPRKPPPSTPQPPAPTPHEKISQVRTPPKRERQRERSPQLDPATPTPLPQRPAPLPLDESRRPTDDDEGLSGRLLPSQIRHPPDVQQQQLRPRRRSPED